MFVFFTFEKLLYLNKGMLTLRAKLLYGFQLYSLNLKSLAMQVYM